MTECKTPRGVREPPERMEQLMPSCDMRHGPLQVDYLIGAVEQGREMLQSGT